MSALSAGLGIADKLLGLSIRVLDRKLPSEAKKLRDLKFEKISIRQRMIDNKKRRMLEIKAGDPNDELIQESYQNDIDLKKEEEIIDEKIEVISSLADAQLSIILAGLSDN